MGDIDKKSTSGQQPELEMYSHSNAVVDHGFDPPMDSGRGTNSNNHGFNRNGENLSLPQNHMFDIEEED